MRFREWNQPPREYARHQWCAVPIIYDDWDKHFLGRKGTGGYRNPNACETPREVCS